MNKIRVFLVIFSLAMLASFLIFNLYNSQNIKEDIALLNTEENNILNRCGITGGKFRFCSYPDNFHSEVIAWDKKEGYPAEGSLRLTFKDNSINHRLGIHLYLTLPFGPYLEEGILEFWVKGKEDYFLSKNLNVYLKEGPIIQRTVSVYLPIRINKDWQKASLPLNKFLLMKETGSDLKDIDKEFSWMIQDVLFSINLSHPEETIELFIGDLRVINNNKTIYELF